MKKIIAVILLCAVLVGCAVAENGTLPDAVFQNAKAATVLIAACDYDKVYTLTGIKLDAASQPELFRKLDSLSAGYTVQTDVSVAWSSGGIWKIAVPLIAPEDNVVPAVVFTLNADYTVAEISAATWRDVELGYKQAEYVSWNAEYKPDYTIVVD